MEKKQTRKRVFGLVAIFLITATTLGAVSWSAQSIQRTAKGIENGEVSQEQAASELPLEVAKKAANWVISQAVAENGGYKWIYNAVSGNTYYETNIQWGAAGIGTFLLGLYQITGNSTYIEYAKGAAQWITSQAVADSGGFKWPHKDDAISDPGWWLSPDVANIGDFFLKMYKETHNSTYMAYATGAARWMIAMEEYESGGCFVPYNPPGKYGSQAGHGISPGREAHTVTFLLHLYNETGNTTYRFYVEKMAEWLILGPDLNVGPEGIKWAGNRPYSTIFSVSYNSGVAAFLYEAYETLKNETYLNYANNAVQWIIDQAVADANGIKWADHQGSTSYPIWLAERLSGGNSGPNDVLLLGYSVNKTENKAYLDCAESYADWCMNQIIGNAYHQAIVYGFMKELGALTQNATYSVYADDIFNSIVANATSDNGYKWRMYDSFRPVIQYGAAGVGYYLAIPEYVWIPEFPVLSMLPLFMTLTVITLFVTRRKNTERLHPNNRN